VAEPKRQTADDLDERLRDPGFTPGIRALPGLVARIAGNNPALAKAATKGVGRIDTPIADRLEPLLALLDASGQKALLRALSVRVGRGEDDALCKLFAASLAADEEGVRLAAARAVGKLPGERARQALRDALAHARSDRERESLSRALLLTGGTLDHEGSAPGLASKAMGKALLIAERDARRTEATHAIEVDVGVPERAPVFFSCRRGLEVVLREELVELLGAPAARATETPGRLALSWSGPLRSLTESRVALRFGFSFEAARATNASAADAVTALLGSPAVLSLIGAITPGSVSFRLAWAEGGKKRSQTWQVARDIRVLAPSLINDPTDSTWQVDAHVDERRVCVDLIPNVVDTRFGYRQGDVPASSHPTIAAALARVAGVAHDDVVWDPFVGSGLELCERARLGRYRKLYGTDVDERALAAARANLDALGAVDYQLSREDARSANIEGLTCVVSNPPMGRRVLRGEDVARVVGDAIRAAARTLLPGGRIVLLSPHPMSSERVALACGLSKTIDRKVDLGGFDAVLQRFERAL